MQTRVLNFPEYIRYCADNHLALNDRSDAKRWRYSCDALQANIDLVNSLEYEYRGIISQFISDVANDLDLQFNAFKEFKGKTKQQVRHSWLYFMSYVAESFIEDCEVLNSTACQHEAVKNFRIEVPIVN